jgi:hypothetical protein
MVGNKDSVKRLATQSLGKALAEISIAELNRRFGITGAEEVGAEEDTGPSYTPALRGPVPYERTDHNVQHRPLGRIAVVFSQQTRNSVKAAVTFTPNEGILPPGTVVGFLQTVKSPLVQTYAKARADEHRNRWSVDRQSDGFDPDRSPYFGIANEGHPRNNEKLQLGTDVKPAVMVDEPTYSGMRVTNWKPQFETAAIILSCPVASLVGSVLAVVDWNVDVDSPSYARNAVGSQRESHTNLPSENFIEAVRIWNEKRYNGVEDQRRELVELGVAHSDVS